MVCPTDRPYKAFGMTTFIGFWASTVVPGGLGTTRWMMDMLALLTTTLHVRLRHNMAL